MCEDVAPVVIVLNEISLREACSQLLANACSDVRDRVILGPGSQLALDPVQTRTALIQRGGEKV